MKISFLRLTFSAIFLVTCQNLCAQDIDTLRNQTPRQADKISLLIYTRVISDANGNIRIDENIVPNFRLNKWLKLELGFRQGERPQHFGSYNHYKVELQSKSFWKTVRFIARLSDNIIYYPSPTYSKSNYLVIAESKNKVSHSLMVLAAGGYVLSYQNNNSLDGWPTVMGNKLNQPIYKVALRYLLKDKGFIEGVYGTYDVFNPYLLSAPFAQVALEYELSDHCALYSYFRYQYNEHFNVPLNNFIGLGVRLH